MAPTVWARTNPDLPVSSRRRASCSAPPGAGRHPQLAFGADQPGFRHRRQPRQRRGSQNWLGRGRLHVPDRHVRRDRGAVRRVPQRRFRGRHLRTLQQLHVGHARAAISSRADCRAATPTAWLRSTPTFPSTISPGATRRILQLADQRPADGQRKPRHHRERFLLSQRRDHRRPAPDGCPNGQCSIRAPHPERMV